MDFIIKLKEEARKIEKQEGGILKFLKLSSSLSANNMVLFDRNLQIKKYSDEVQILEEFYKERYDLYGKRKLNMMKVIKKECSILRNKARFIKEINTGELKIQNIPRVDIIQKMKDANYLT